MKDYICDVCGNRISRNYIVTSKTFPSIDAYNSSVDILQFSTRLTRKDFDCKDAVKVLKTIDICSACAQAVLDALDKRNPNLINPPENEEPSTPTTPETPNVTPPGGSDTPTE